MGAYFGDSVAISGDTIVVGTGAWGSREGAYVFSREGSTWTEQAKLVRRHGSSATITVGGTVYGADVMDGSPFASGSGQLVDCGNDGAFTADTQCNGPGGHVCLIQRGSISFAEKVLNCQASAGSAAVIYNNEPGPLYGTHLGETVSTIPSVGISDVDGAALLGISGASATVVIEASIYAHESTVSTEFGASVGIDGDHIVVGDPGDANHNGSAYVFSRAAGSSPWELDSDLTPGDGASAGARFGTSVAIHDGTVIIGADSDAWSGSA